jgi:hypothetical protein
MRTTVTLDPDVEVLLRDAVRKRGEPFKQVLNEALRDSLRGKTTRNAVQPFRQRTFNLGRPLVDLSKANVLADELGDAAVIAKLNARR